MAKYNNENNNNGKGTTSTTSKGKSKSKNNYRRGNRGGHNRPNPKSGNDRNDSVPTNNSNGFGECVEGANDPAWYSRYPELLSSASKMPVTWRVGRPFTKYKPGEIPASPHWAFMPDYSDDMSTKQYDIPVGDVSNDLQTESAVAMAIEVVPAPGYSTDNNSPISNAARQMWSQVRANFSASISAEAPDFMIQCLALSSIYAYIQWLKRIYRVINTASSSNYAFPKGILNLMGFKDDDVDFMMDQPNRLLGIINELVHMTEQFRCPDIFDVFRRHVWLNSNIYVDHNDVSGQMYFFNMHYFYRFNLVDTPDQVQAGGLELEDFFTFRGISSGVITDKMYQFGTWLIHSLNSWDSCYDINGYLIKAYPDSRISMSLQEANEKMTLDYAPEVLLQIMNSRALPNIPGYMVNVDTMPRVNTIPISSQWTFSEDYRLNSVNCTISQDPKTNAILIQGYADGRETAKWLSDHNQVGEYTHATYGGPTLVNSDILLNMPTPDNAEINQVLATRLTPTYEVTENGIVAFNAGTEVVLNYRLLTIQHDGFIKRSNIYAFGNDLLFAFVGSGSSATAAILAELARFTSRVNQYTARLERLLNQFEWGPIMHKYMCNFNTNHTVTDYKYLGAVSEFMYPGVMPKSQLDEIHRICQLSEYHAFE